MGLDQNFYLVKDKYLHLLNQPYDPNTDYGDAFDDEIGYRRKAWDLHYFLIDLYEGEIPDSGDGNGYSYVFTVDGLAKGMQMLADMFSDEHVYWQADGIKLLAQLVVAFADQQMSGDDEEPRHVVYCPDW